MNRINSKYIVALLSFCLIAGLAFSGISWSAEKNKPSEDNSKAKLVQEQRFKNWTVNCYAQATINKTNCLLMQTIVLKETNSRLIQIAMVKQKQEISGRITVPLGVFLPNGVELQIDKGEASRFPLIHCDQQGCHTTIRIKPEFLQSLKAGNQLKVTFSDITQRSIGVPVSLLGFTAGFKALK